MTLTHRISRRSVVKAAAASTVLGAPGLLMAQPAAVKIGLVHPVSGGLAFGGAQGRLGCQIAIDEINAAGGIKSMGGAKVEALMGDSQSRPEIGVSEVERLNQAGADCFVGCYSSGIALPATQAAAKYNTPFMVDVGVSDLIVNRGLKNVFRLAPGFGKCTDDAIMALGDVNKAAGNPAKKVVIVHEESEFGTGTAKLLAGKLPSIGMEAAEIIKILPGLVEIDRRKLLELLDGARFSCSSLNDYQAKPLLFNDVKILTYGAIELANEIAEKNPIKVRESND